MITPAVAAVLRVSALPDPSLEVLGWLLAADGEIRWPSWGELFHSFPHDVGPNR